MDEKLAELITLYLQINPEPSDKQFHCLAESIGVDKETLEAIVYEMLADMDEDGEDDETYEEEASSTHYLIGTEPDEEEQCACEGGVEVEADLDAPGDPEQSEDEEAMEGEGDPFTTPTDDLLFTDGAPEGTSNIEENQDALRDDGATIGDEGIDLYSDKEALIDDGAVPMRLPAHRLNAAVRLRRTKR